MLAGTLQVHAQHFIRNIIVWGKRYEYALNRSSKGIDMPSVNLYNNSDQGLVKVSTGVLQLEKLSAGDASNHKLNTNANNELAYAA